MSELLWKLEQAAFYFINHDLKNPVFDLVLPVVTDVRFWVVPLVLVFALIVYREGRYGLWLFGQALMIFLLTDGIGTHIFKAGFQRLRPYKVLVDVYQLVGSGNFSFPSNHAANTTALWCFFHHYYPQWAWRFCWILPVIYLSRIYCGVHYTSDVLFGAGLGLGVSAAVLWAGDYLARYRKEPDLAE